MEHISVKKLDNGYYKLVPEKGYLLSDGHTTYTQAVTKMLDGWSTVKI